MENRASTIRNIFPRGVVRRVLQLFIGFALLSGVAYSQDGDQKGKIPTHSRFTPYGPMPYTAESKTITVLTESNTPLYPENTNLHVQDSQGRLLDAYGQGSQGRDLSAFGNFIVDDLIAGRRISWYAPNPEAKLLEYATPVSGRRSCWQVAPEDLSVTRGERQLLPRGARCEPAERFQPTNVACRNEVEADGPLTLKWSLAQATYQDCARQLSAVVESNALEKKDEDLGTDTIQGFKTHGCRSTTKTAVRTLIREDWIIEFRAEKYSFGFEVRSKWTEQRAGEQTWQATTELTRLDLAEPAPSVFEPPKKYAIKTVVMHEVPCAKPATQPASSTPSP